MYAHLRKHAIVLARAVSKLAERLACEGRLAGWSESPQQQLLIYQEYI
jgi:hypothetical protein